MPNQVVRREADRQQIRNLIRAQLLVLNRRPRQIGQMVVGEGEDWNSTVEFRPRLLLVALQDVREEVILSLVIAESSRRRARIGGFRQQPLPHLVRSRCRCAARWLKLFTQTGSSVEVPGAGDEVAGRCRRTSRLPSGRFPAGRIAERSLSEMPDHLRSALTGQLQLIAKGRSDQAVR
jgi:hypothetical protein